MFRRSRRSIITGAPRGAAGALAVTILMLAALGGCASDPDTASSALMVKGKYDFYDCSQLTTRAKELGERDAELQGLIARAGSDSGGRLISALSYDSDLAVTRGEAAEVRLAQQERKCAPAEVVPASLPVPRKRK